MASIEDKPLADDSKFGRDEMNICEFPLTLLTDKPPAGVRTVTYGDRIHDRESGRDIDRKVTVIGSDKYGLATATDADVLIALIQHTKLINGFTDPKVPFSRYEILQILRWSDDGYSYKRLTQSLKRWVGVTVEFNQSWRDKSRRQWASHSTHILSDVIFNYSTGRRSRSVPEDGTCWYVWGDRMFESLKVGNLKKLDLELYFGLRLPTAKFMYRYLDKHFYKRSSLRFDLSTFAHEKLGMSRKYKPSQVKNKLEGPIRELVLAGFIESCENRYEKTADGRWLINFSRCRSNLVVVRPEEVRSNDVVSRLLERGVSESKARELAEQHSAEDIDRQIRAMIWRADQSKTSVKDQAGYLVSAISKKWAIPSGFVEAEVADERKAAANIAAVEAVAENEMNRARMLAEDDRIRAFWDSLQESEREEFDKEAVADLGDDERGELSSHRVGSPVYNLLLQAARQRLIRIKLGLTFDESY